MRIFFKYFLAFALVFASVNFVFAQPKPQQETGGIEQSRQILEKEKKLREKIEKPPTKSTVEQPPIEAVRPEAAGQKIKVIKINVTGVTLFSEKEIRAIVASFENREMTVGELSGAANRITDLYRKKGYITSRAYLPPQQITDGVVEIRVVEGTMGNVEIRGNRYFKSSLLRKRVTLKKDEPFNFSTLQLNLWKINQYPDRNARAVLAPGKEPGTTDVILEVKDRLPIHVGFSWNNFGSRYIGNDLYQTSLTDNNFLGFDDILTLQYQTAEADAYRLSALRYIFPVADDKEIGFYTTSSYNTLQREFEDIQARGKSRVYSGYFSQSFVRNENVDFQGHVGFDSKDVFNFQLGSESSRDRLRIAKTGVDFDWSDALGRGIFGTEISTGIPDFMGSLEEQDARASRSGSGGKFIKTTINFLRLWRMPFSSMLLVRSQAQISPYILTATEQFQLGGIANVRGYPPAELVGDSGYAHSAEWSLPPYFIPKNLKVPFTNTTFYDALRLSTFYDWGNVRLRRPQAGEEKYKTIRSAGCGVRFNLASDLSMRADFAWPLDNTPSDGKHFHPWFQVTKDF